jgi:hypothetical protein
MAEPEFRNYSMNKLQTEGQKVPGTSDDMMEHFYSL